MSIIRSEAVLVVSADERCDIVSYADFCKEKLNTKSHKIISTTTILHY